MSSSVACQPSSSWMLNTLGQNPCEVYADLSTICTTNQRWAVTPLVNSSTTYAPPTSALINPCQCNSVAYTLVQACATCQNATVGTWAAWRKNCPDAFATEMWPYDVPAQTKIPPWAELGSPTSGGAWNATAARAYAASSSSTVVPTAVASHGVSSSTAPGFRISLAAFISSLIGTAIGSICLTVLLIVCWDHCWGRRWFRGSGEQTPEPDSYNTWPEAPRTEFMRERERERTRR